MALMDLIGPINEYIKAKPWTMADEGGTLIFGLEGQEGNVSYVVVSGAQNGYGLALLRSTQALVGYAALLHAMNGETGEMEKISLQLDQDCLEMMIMQPNEQAMNEWLAKFGVVADAWPENLPVLRRRIPGRIPRPIEESEEPLLSEALKAAADFATNEALRRTGEATGDQLGSGSIPCARREKDGSFSWSRIEISKNMQIQYPSPALDDELAARRLRRLPLNDSEVMCAVRRLPMPLDEEAKGVPTVMLLLDSRKGVVGAPIIGDYDSEYGELAGEYLGYVEEYGRPRRILAADPRAFCLLSELAAQMSTPIQRVSGLEAIDDAMYAYMELLSHTAARQAMQDDTVNERELFADNPDKKDVGGSVIDPFTGDREEMAAHFREEFGQAAPGRNEENLLLRLTCPDEPAYWMIIAAKPDGTLRQLDQEVKNHWLTGLCDDEMSRMTVGSEVYSSDCRRLKGRSMNAKLSDALKDVLSFSYEINPDEWSETRLKVEVLRPVMLPPRRQKVVRIAQNYMPEYPCVRCGQLGKAVVGHAAGSFRERVLCKRCAAQDGGDNLFELANSPRTGVDSLPFDESNIY